MDGVGEAAAATPSGVSLLLLCPRCYDVVSDVMAEKGGWIVQEYAQMIVDVGDSWKMVYPMLDLWLNADSSGSLFRRRSRAEVPVLKFDGVFGVVLPRSDFFNGNGLLISDGAASSSGEEVICLASLWWLLRWCRK